MTIDKDFFTQYQRQILWFVNTKVGRRFFRIQNDIPADKKIERIEPNCFTWIDKVEIKGRKKITTYKRDVRTHAKFAKRLNTLISWLPFSAVKLPQLNGLWYLQPKLGLSTLTVYPDAGTGATTVDGYLQNNNHADTFANVRARTLDGTDIVNTSGASLYVYLGSTGVSNQFNYLIRAGMTFDNSTVPLNANITDAVVSVYGKSKSTGMVDSSNIVGFTPASNNNLVLGDYSQFGSTKFSTDLAISSFSTSGYNDYVLNTNGIANIVKGGISKFGWLLTSDITNTQPTWVSGATVFAEAASADTTGTSNDPKLLITYTVTTFIPKIIMN